MAVRTLLLRFVALLAVLQIGSPAGAEAPKPFRIGSFLALSGQASFLGVAEKMAIDMLEAELNAKGGVGGRPIEIVFYDSKSSVKDAIGIVHRLIDQDEVDLIMGGSTTGETMAVIPLIEEAHIPYMAIAGAAEIVQPVKRYVFKTPHTEQMSLEKIFDKAASSQLKKVALLSGAGGYDQSCRTNAKAIAPKYGVAIVADELHGNGDTDMTPQLTNMRNADPSALLYCGFGAPASIVAKNYHQLGLKPRLIMTHGAAARAYIDGADGAAEGTWVTGSALLAFKDLSPEDPIYPVTKNFVESFQRQYKEDPGTFSGYGYDALMLVTAALEAAGSNDKEQLRDALESLSGVPGTNGVYAFSPTDHLGFKAESLRMLEVRGGEFRIVK